MKIEPNRKSRFEATFSIKFAHARPKTPSPSKPSNDGDIHISGTAPEIGLMTLLETVLGPLWVWLAVGEEPSRAAVLCGVLIVAVLAVHSALALRGEGAVRLSGPV